MIMRYKLLYTTFKRSVRTAVILDFKQGELLEFPLTEQQVDELPPDLQQYIHEKWEKIMTGYWDYKP